MEQGTRSRYNSYINECTRQDHRQFGCSPTKSLVTGVPSASHLDQSSARANEVTRHEFLLSQILHTYIYHVWLAVAIPNRCARITHCATMIVRRVASASFSPNPRSRSVSTLSQATNPSCSTFAFVSNLLRSL